GPAHQRQDPRRGFLDPVRPGTASDQLGQHVGVRGRLQPGEPALRREQRGELAGIGEVAVVPQRDRHRRRRPEGRLRVRPHGGAGRRVAAVRDGDVATQRGERRLVEDLGNEAHLLVHDDPPAIADRDARRLLAAMLQRVQSVVGELGDVFPRGPDAKDAAGVPRRAVVRIEIVRKTPVWLSHDTSLFGQVSGRNADRSDRAPLALTAPVRTASSQSSRPVASLNQVSGSVSTTLGGVPRVWRGPATACTAATGTTLISTERPGLTLSSSCSRNRAADLRAARSGSAPASSAAATTATPASPSGSGLRAGTAPALIVVIARSFHHHGGQPKMAGSVADQTCLSSVSGISKTPSTVRVSPVVTPRTVAGTPCSSASAANSLSRPGTTETSARAADSLNRSVNASPRSATAQPRSPYRQASASAIARPPSDRSCALASTPAAAAAVTTIASCRSASRSADGGRPPRCWWTTPAHADPPNSSLVRPS